MEKTIIKLEELLGKKYEDWTSDTVIEIVNSKEALSLFTPDIIFNLVDTRKNDEVHPILLPVKYGYIIRDLKEKLQEKLLEVNNDQITKETFEKDILKLREECKNPIEMLGYNLTIITTFENYDLSKEAEDVRQNIKDYKTMLLSLDFETGFEVTTEMLDILFPFREIYFQKYQEDLFKDDKEIEELLDKLNKLTSQMREFFDTYQEDEEHVHDENCDHEDLD